MFNLKDRKPYLNSIKLLNMLNIIASPVHQLKLILHMKENFGKEIDEFYSENAIYFEGDVDPDIILNLFIYVVSQSNLNNLQTYINLIDIFISKNLKDSLSGYYFCVLKAAIDFLFEKFENLDF